MEQVVTNVKRIEKARRLLLWEENSKRERHKASRPKDSNHNFGCMSGVSSRIKRHGDVAQSKIRDNDSPSKIVLRKKWGIVRELLP